MELFRTYVKGDGKSPAVSKGTTLKNRKHVLSLEDASKNPSYGGLLKKGIIDISFDTEEISDDFWNMADVNDWQCAVMENPTNHHIHSFWKIPEGWKWRDGKDKTCCWSGC